MANNYRIDAMYSQCQFGLLMLVRAEYNAAQRDLLHLGQDENSAECTMCGERGTWGERLGLTPRLGDPDL